jgi:hypothetical protein
MTELYDAHTEGARTPRDDGRPTVAWVSAGEVAQAATLPCPFSRAAFCGSARSGGCGSPPSAPEASDDAAELVVWMDTGYPMVLKRSWLLRRTTLLRDVRGMTEGWADSMERYALDVDAAVRSRVGA